jgi:hypothetical protein
MCRCASFLSRTTLLGAAVALVTATVSTISQAGTLIGSYDLTAGTYANSISGTSALPPLVVQAATSGSYGFVTSGTDAGWFWSGANAPGTGLSVSGLPANEGTAFGHYSIGMRFSLGSVTGYRRLIRFKSSDFGQYVNNAAFEFYDGAVDPSGGSLAANTFVDFVLTRDGVSNQVNAYLNGSSSPIFTFIDGSNDASTDVNRTLGFFRDDALDFSPSGRAALIRIWDAPLAAADIPTAMVVVPEPTTAINTAIIAAGCAVRMLLRRRRR